MNKNKGYSRTSITKDDVCLISFPRTGSNYLRSLLNDSLSYDILNSHSLGYAQSKRIITLVREPYHTIKSLKTMTLHFYPDKNIDNLTNSYVDFFEQMYNNAEVVIKYETLVSTPEHVIDYLSKYLKIYNYETFSSDLTGDSIPDGGLATSKSSPLYDSIDMSKEDFTEANKIYKKMIDRASI